ncbi:hypothetical protein C8J56DRAFT_980412 [Mycena floridula]|nr:hypothetical protein C8J56DRAFT_980412 [Mycena floridula]
MNVLPAPSLDNVPQEVLEHIALFSGTESFLGPPSSLPSLLVTCRRMDCLSMSSNPCLYAAIFTAKFDSKSACLRLGSITVAPAIFAQELRTRCINLKRIRAKFGASIQGGTLVDGESLRDLLYHAYILMIENDGKNRSQLRDFAKIDDWLHDYWFTESGASLARRTILRDRWPLHDENIALAMWLFWFFLKPDEYERSDEAAWTVMKVLKVFALGAHIYPLTAPAWIHFAPQSRHMGVKPVQHYSHSHSLSVPPVATPAILAYLLLVNQMHDVLEYTPAYQTPLPLAMPASNEWASEWGRSLSLGKTTFSKVLDGAFSPGSIEGVWEGFFTYTEFTTYAALMSGAPPATLQKSLIIRHRQTWKLREYHLLGPRFRDPSVPGEISEPLSAGNPLRSFFPTGTQFKEYRDRLEVLDPASSKVLCYRRGTLWKGNEDLADSSVYDIILTGEGHSAWGQFNLVGRIRPCDGFISLCKEYTDGDRGKWLYRGYLVGNVNGILSGRWRDTLSPANSPGYEGCFTMTRRR